MKEMERVVLSIFKTCLFFILDVIQGAQSVKKKQIIVRYAQEPDTKALINSNACLNVPMVIIN